MISSWTSGGRRRAVALLLLAGTLLSADLRPALALPPEPAPATYPAYLGGLAAGSLTSRIPTLSDPTQTWELYLPKSYDPARKWPVLFIFDPRAQGKAAAELFRPAADEFGWILASSNNTMSDGPAEPNARALNATLPDVMKRLPIDERRIYATGFSGGAVLAWTVGLKGRYLAGVISVGGRPAPEHLALVPNFPLFSTAGERDFNYQPTRELDEIAARAGVPHRLEVHPGPHSWCPPETARRAIAWMEILAMRDGRKLRDDASVAATYASDLAEAEAMATAGEPLAAGRRYAEIATTYAGLVGEAELRKAAARSSEILGSPAAKTALKEEKAAEKYEAQAARRAAEAAGLLRSSERPVATGELRNRLAIEDALARKAAGGVAGRAATRALATISTHLGFYLTQELFAKGEYRRAIPGLELVTQLSPADTFMRYNLACAEARSGQVEEALATLSVALDHGLPQPTQMATDPDLESLRSRPEFAVLLARARELETAAKP